MAIKAFITALALVPAGFVLAVQTQPPATQQTPWFPLVEGTKWHYRVDTDGVPGAKKNPAKKNDDAAKKVVMRVDKLVELEFKTGEKLEKWQAYRLVGISEERELVEYVAVRSDGVYKFAGGDRDTTPPLRILKLPPVSGSSWECNVPLEGGPAKGAFTVRDQQIEIGNQTYETKHVSGEFMIGSQRMSADYWFAARIGIVKYKIKRGTFNVTLELERFEPAASK